MSSSSEKKVIKTTKVPKEPKPVSTEPKASTKAIKEPKEPKAATKEPKQPKATTKEPKATTKETKASTKEPKEPKERKTYKKEKLQPILEDEILLESSSSPDPISRVLYRSVSETPVNNLHDNMDMDNIDNMDNILQEIHDSEIALAMDASFASNLTVQMDSNNLIEEDMDLILEKIRERENIQSLEEDEIKELIKQNELKHNQEMADEAFARSLEEEDNYHYNNYNNRASTSTSNHIAVDSIVSNNNNNKKDIINEHRSIREQQDIEYARVLQEDIERDTRKHENEHKTKMNASLLDDSDENEENKENEEREENEESDCDDKPKTLEELRKIRLAFYAKK